MQAGGSDGDPGMPSVESDLIFKLDSQGEAFHDPSGLAHTYFGLWNWNTPDYIFGHL